MKESLVVHADVADEFLARVDAALADVELVGDERTQAAISRCGPATDEDYATEFLGTIIYRQTIANDHVGYGAAVSVVLLIVALVMAIILQLRGRERTR